jgi:hypothetical protein
MASAFWITVSISIPDSGKTVDSGPSPQGLPSVRSNRDVAFTSSSAPERQVGVQVLAQGTYSERAVFPG